MKLDIIGSVASGKTTLARKLSRIYDIPFFEKDNIVWERTPNGDRQRSDEERDRMFREIISGSDWIVEGSPRKTLCESFGECDHIILLDVPTRIRLLRAVGRWIRQRTGRERYNTKPTVKFLLYNIKWIFEYNRDRKKLIGTLSAYGAKYRRFTSSEEALSFIEGIYGKR